MSKKTEGHSFNINDLKIASPCDVGWGSMQGDDRKRFCGSCKLHVHNVANMTSAEVESLFANSDGQVCVRLFRRFDGTVITQDCPKGVRAVWKKQGSRAAMLYLLALILSSVGTRAEKLMGKVTAPTMDTQSEAVENKWGTSSTMGGMPSPAMLGSISTPFAPQEKVIPKKAIKKKTLR